MTSREKWTTEREAVERLATECDKNAAAAWKHGAHLLRDGEVPLSEACAGVIRALGDERDAAVRECERLRIGGCARGQTTTQWCAEAVQMMAERDAAQAEVARQHKLWRTAAGISNECTWNRSTRPIADRLQKLIREAFEGGAR